MNTILSKIRTSLLLVPVLALAFSFAIPGVSFAECDTSSGLDATTGANCAQGNNTPSDLFDGDDSIFKNVVNILLFLVGAISVIMLIFGGIKYVTSGGSQEQVTSAKNTIMYAIIGIIVALLAYAVVSFVIDGLAAK